MHIIIERSRDPHLFIKREEQPIVTAYVAKREREREKLSVRTRVCATHASRLHAPIGEVSQALFYI